jgi:hypothetical protein
VCGFAPVYLGMGVLLLMLPSTHEASLQSITRSFGWVATFRDVLRARLSKWLLILRTADTIPSSMLGDTMSARAAALNW